MEGVIDVHYASLTSQGVQHRVFYRDGHPSRYQPRPTGLNFGEQTGTGVFPRGKDHRTYSTTRLPVTGNSHLERERTNDFALWTISTLSLSFLFLPCHKFLPLFPNHAFPKCPFFSHASFPARKFAIIFCCQLCVIMHSTGCAVQYWGITLIYMCKVCTVCKLF